MSAGSPRTGPSAAGPLRLLHVLYSGKGGLGTYFLELVASDRHERFAHSAIFYGIETLDPEYERFASERGIPYTAIQKRRGPDLVSAIRLVSAMKTPTDAIVLHSGAGAAAIGALLRTATSRGPLIQVEHTTSEVKTLRDRFWTSLLRLVSDRTVIFYPRHEKELGMGSDRCVLIPKRPDVAFFHKAPRAPDGEIRIGMQGRLSRHKDHATLLRAFAIASQRSATSLSLHIAGDGKERPGLERLTRELGISSAVHFHGMLDRSDLRAMLQSLDIYVHATHGETMCFAIMEAQACGLPVIGSDVGGVRDAIEDGVNGLLHRPRDAEALADLLLELIEAPEKRKSLGEMARARMLEEASRQPTAEAYYEMLLAVLAERGQRPES